ncbi:hypothetical protein L6452_38835 [Arctium lappa]|uniref:Uncharacterized protein n=1 Tax=Arctium lappa TaxID=4217 RepID=A0ACB8XSC1_ARCLA|nr:hypothetical protein L6452_38835 [Arctium lappa]
MPTTDERGNTVLSARDVAVMYMPEIPTIEDERDKLKNQNLVILKQIQELKFKLSNSDKILDCIKCANNAKSDFTELQAELVELQHKFKAFEDKITALELKNVELKKSLQADKVKSKLKTSSTQQLSDLSKKTLQEKKDLELRCIKLSQEVSEFEKILVTERDTFARERKVLEDKTVELPKQISALQDLLEKERKAFQEKKKSFELEKKNVEKRNLTSKLTVLSSDVLKEQMAKSDLRQKFDTIIAERNILTGKIKDLEAANVQLSEKISADVINQSPYDNSTESSVDGPTSFYVISLGKQSKKEQMVWRVKGSSDEKKKDKASTSTSKAKKNSVHKGNMISTIFRENVFRALRKPLEPLMKPSLMSSAKKFLSLECASEAVMSSEAYLWKSSEVGHEYFQHFYK